MTLLLGMVILSGTLERIGFTRPTRLFLCAGDVISVVIEKIGTLTNSAVKEWSISEKI